MRNKILWTMKQRKEIDKEFQHKKGCSKSIFDYDSYILCGNATYDGITKVFCRSCRAKFMDEKFKKMKNKTGTLKKMNKICINCGKPKEEHFGEFKSYCFDFR